MSTSRPVANARCRARERRASRSGSTGGHAPGFSTHAARSAPLSHASACHGSAPHRTLVSCPINPTLTPSCAQPDGAGGAGPAAQPHRPVRQPGAGGGAGHHAGNGRRRMISLDTLDAVVRQLRDAAFDARALRLARVCRRAGGVVPPPWQRWRPGWCAPIPADSPVPFGTFRAAVERTRFAAVFTAHPTFSLPYEQADALARAASGEAAAALRVPPSVQADAGRGVRPGGRRHRPGPRRDRRAHHHPAANRGADLARPVAQPDPQAGHPGHLGRLRHGMGAPISAGGTRCGCGW